MVDIVANLPYTEIEKGVKRMTAFGNFLYEPRKEKGLTQQELAEKLNITNKAVSKWETGEAFPGDPFSPALIISLAEPTTSLAKSSVLYFVIKILLTRIALNYFFLNYSLGKVFGDYRLLFRRLLTKA